MTGTPSTASWLACCGEANVTAGVYEIRSEYYEDGGMD